EVLGAEANWGPHARARHTREVILKLAVQHDQRAAVELFSREFLPAATAMAQGITGFAGGRPAVTPVVRLFSFLIDKRAVDIAVEIDGRPLPFEPAATGSEPAPATRVEPAPIALPAGPVVELPLIAVAYGRSG